MTTRVVVLQRAVPADAIKVLKFIHKAHEANNPDLPPIIDRFALPWITNVICFGVAFLACIDGRIIGTIGLLSQSYPWNEYQNCLRSQWLHVLDIYADSPVRDRLMAAAHGAASEMQYDMRVDVPAYLRKETDKNVTSIESGYFFDGSSYTG